MPSLIPGFEYDVFISYRQKDNKGDRWVSEFVEALKTELESTFKEEISVYFDINPHDGLLETHDVDESLKEKLKCLVFIPIISRTYCDPKSFAWEHEFKAFIELASKDHFGLKIRLPNGNVANRILPVQIHDLDTDDKKLYNAVLGGFIRGIEFIYKELGVDRPLTSKDNEEKNLNKTSYRNQINKVALAIKEIVSANKNEVKTPEPTSTEVSGSYAKSGKNNRMKILTGSSLILLLIILGILYIPKLIKPKDPMEKSIAVLPFDNLSSDKEQVWFSDGITDLIINQLSKISGLRVLGRTSTLKYKEEKKSILEIGKELGVNFIIEGTVQKQEDQIRISAQLIRVKNEAHIWSELYDKEWGEIFNIQTDIAKSIASNLKTLLSPKEINQIENMGTDNVEAYRLYMIGNFLMMKYNEEAIRKAIDNYQQAIELDSSFAQAYAGLAYSYLNLGGWAVPLPSSQYIPQVRTWVLKALEINNNLAEAYFILGSINYVYEWDWNGAEQAYKKGMELNPNCVWGRIDYANFLTAMGRFRESITIGQKTLELNPLDPSVYAELAFAMFFNGQNEKALELYNKGLELNPNGSQILGCLVLFYARKGLFDQAISTWEKELELFDNEIHKIPAFDLGLAGQVFGMAGRRDEAIILLNELNRRAGEGEYMHTSYLAVIYIGLGENEKAIELLEKGVDDKDFFMVWLKVNSVFDPLRSNERFKKLLRKMGFEE